MLRCKDVAALVGTDALMRAPLRQRVAVRIHLAMCRHCRAYVRALQQLARTARDMGFLDVAAVGDVESVIQAVRRATKGTQ